MWHDHSPPFRIEGTTPTDVAPFPPAGEARGEALRNMHHHCPPFGSSTSRMPSPRRLNASEMAKIASPGIVATHQ